MESDGRSNDSANRDSNGSSNDYSNGIEKRISTRLVIVPMLNQAHAVTAIRFAKKLSKRGVIVTLVMIKEHADVLHRIYTREALQTLRINIESLDTYKPPEISVPLYQCELLKAAFQPFKEKLIANKAAGLPGPTCILADRFLPWIEDVANELDIPRYSFASNGAITVRFIQSYHEKEKELKSLPNGPDWFQKTFEILRKQPGLEPLKRASDMISVSLDNHWFQYLCDIGRAFTGAEGIVVNSFYALEHQAVESIRNAYPGSNKFKVLPVYPIGPLSIAEEFKNETFLAGVEDSHAECIQWLGAQPPQSVLYICLGSNVLLFGEQIVHLALALEGSQCRFLWVLSKRRRNFNTLEDVLPPGYLDRVCGRGKIVSGWVGQLEILSNPVVAGFLSHCGWQSVLESMTCGVPLLGWPHIAEQRLNCRYIEDFLKVGMRVSEKEANELVEQHEFEEAIKTFMFGKERLIITANAAKMKSMASEAVADGGSSDVALDQLIESFSNHNRRN